MDRYENILVWLLKPNLSNYRKAYEIFMLTLGPQQLRIFKRIGFGKENAKTAAELSDDKVTTSNVHTQIRQIREVCDIIKIDDTNSRRYKYYIEL